MRDPGTKCLVYAILCIVALNSVVSVGFVGEAEGTHTCYSEWYSGYPL